MKILLIYPPHALQNEQKGLKGFGPPLGLMYLATILKNKGHEIKIIDMDTFNVDIESVIKIIDKDHYNHIGISVFTRTRKIPYALAEIIRNEFPDVYISFGGPHCCLLPQEAMLDCVDSVVSGESELIITKVFEERMKGIIEAPIPNHLDELPFPDRALLDHKPYGYLENIKFAKLVTSLSSSRGCPFDCSFCTRIKTMRYFRYRSPKNIVKEIKEIEKQGFNGIWIIDDNFTALPERAIRVAELIKQNNIKMDFGYQGRFLPHKTMWKKLSQNGFCQTFAGIEHIKPEIVRYFNKYHRPNKWKNIVENTMKIITDNNVMIGGSVILGAPQEKEEDARDLINWCYEIGIDIINTNELEYVYGSKLWFEAVENGLFAKDRLHVRITELANKDYLNDMFQLAWDLSVKNWKKIASKLNKNKRDKITPTKTALTWKAKDTFYFFKKAHDGYGYGKRAEVKIDKTIGFS